MIELQYFEAAEFREWADKMSPRLLVKLDILRYRIGSPIIISQHPAALGRYSGPSESDHNYEKWGEVRAVDCFVSGVYKMDQACTVIADAYEVGITAIGVYPEWINAHGEKQVGFHLGDRPARRMGAPATWGYVGGRFVAMNEALRAMNGT